MTDAEMTFAQPAGAADALHPPLRVVGLFAGIGGSSAFIAPATRLS
jgi:hypothetical protein